MSYAKLEYDPLLDAHKCNECGNWYKGLSRHITRHHRMSADEYRSKWGLNKNESLLSFSTLKKLSEKALLAGVSKNFQSRYQFKKGESRIQRYKRSEQTRRRLRILRQISRNSTRKKRVFVL
jgi:hypothetical protein